MTVTLADATNRNLALSAHDRTLLVEAGAGSGKTAILAGRIAMMLVQGIEPKYIAAVTFTELAASELLHRVRAYTERLLEGSTPRELLLVLPAGLSGSQRTALLQAQADIDDITCSTIHGFCQRLIRPYPVEANIDPGATIMDRDQAELAFNEVIDEWLREQLGADAQGLLAELILANVDSTISTVKVVLRHIKQYENLQPPPLANLANAAQAFTTAVSDYRAALGQAGFSETETTLACEAFERMATAVDALDLNAASGLVTLLNAKPDEALCTKTGTFSSFQKKGKWGEAAKASGRSKAEGERIAGEVKSIHERCTATWTALQSAASSRVMADLLPVLKPAIERIQEYKRSSALMDFDDLLRSARDLLRDYPDVCSALAQKYRHVLVDEFQDTDPIQSEIFWRLSGSPPVAAVDFDNANWRGLHIRPGALFLVGDPKQAIYRFRGADVQAYVEARDALRAQDASSVVSISVNFRSYGPILTFVNETFAAPLSAPGQPGFIALDEFHEGRPEGPCVVKLPVAAADANGKAKAEVIRDTEAEAVAALCAHLVANEVITDPETGMRRACRAGDIALLAPTGADLWRYEQALEHKGLPVATQAGKGFFRRQEIQDLIALTRVLADGRDSLALGSLLRGPLIGLSEESILDVISGQTEPDEPGLLTLSLDASRMEEPLARWAFVTLQGLRRSVRSTTPHALLSKAVAELRVRAILAQRTGRQAERSLANVDLFLNLSRTFDVRGITAFSDAMRTAWEEESRSVEGRPDAQEEAVALYSMHASKGLEWPIVVPINGATGVIAPDKDIVSRQDNRLYCPVLGVEPVGYSSARDTEESELQRERVRLWYVAATRAREILVIPECDAELGKSAWNQLVPFDLNAVPEFELPDDVPAVVTPEQPSVNEQTSALFEQQAQSIKNAHHSLSWKIPSREEDASKPIEQDETSEIFVPTDDTVMGDGISTIAVQGGRERGVLLHKLLEEVLTGEIADDLDALSSRASELAPMLGCPISDNASEGVSPLEVATTARRALEIPVIAGLRPRLVPEYWLYDSTEDGTVEFIRTGIADAVAYGEGERAEVVVDWKSDVDPTEDAIRHYMAQLRSYIEMAGATNGYLVFATMGTVHEVVAR